MNRKIYIFRLILIKHTKAPKWCSPAYHRGLSRRGHKNDGFVAETRGQKTKVLWREFKSRLGRQYLSSMKQFPIFDVNFNFSILRDENRLPQIF